MLGAFGGAALGGVFDLHGFWMLLPAILGGAAVFAASYDDGKRP
jgi:hypothetical protein